MLQEEMIARVREICQVDEKIVGAWMYGSFTKGEGDMYSDIEFLIYIADDVRAGFDPVVWLSRIAPVGVYFINEFDVGAVIFENLIRGEFHFERASDMPRLRKYGRMSGFPPVEAMLISDRTGELRGHLAAISGPGPERGGREETAQLWHSFLNWMLFGSYVLARGERMRALELLWYVQRYLLQLARLAENQTEHWQTPSKSAERELSDRAQQRYQACTASLRGSELEGAYRAAWEWGVELASELVGRQPFDLHPALLQKMNQRFQEVFRD
jgi:lincosamide nucleotidyltransferase